MSFITRPELSFLKRHETFEILFSGITPAVLEFVHLMLGVLSIRQLLQSLAYNTESLVKFFLRDD